MLQWDIHSDICMISVNKNLELWIVNRKLKIVSFRWKIVTSKSWILGWQTGCHCQDATVGQTLRHSLWIVNRKLKIVCFRWKIVTSKLWILGWQTGCHFQDATVGHALRHSLCKLTINGQIAFVQDTANITLNVRNTALINKNAVTIFFFQIYIFHWKSSL